MSSTDWDAMLSKQKVKKKTEQNNGCFFKVPNSVIDKELGKINGNAAKVLFVIMRFTNKEGKAWPGQLTIGKLSGCSRSAVKRAIKSLEGRYLRVDRSGRNNVYTLLFKKVEE